MTKAEFKKYIDRLTNFPGLIDRIENLTIDWETDIDKCDFSVLQSEIKMPPKDRYDAKIEWYTAADVLVKVEQCKIFENVDLHRLLNLVDLIDSGIKIIPPIAMRSVEIIDGESVLIGNTPINSLISDGTHRLILSKLSNQTKIPVIIIDQIIRFVFSKDLWELYYDEEYIRLVHLQNGKRFELRMDRCSFGELRRSGDIVLNVF